MKRQTLLKSTLCLLMALVCNVAWAQTPVLELEKDQIGTSYPYELSATDAEKVFALDKLTVAVLVDAPATVSGRRALFATSDPTQATNSSAEGKNSRYVAYGMNGSDVGYLASWRDGDRFTGGAAITANTKNLVVVYVIDPENITFKAYVNGVKEFEKVNGHADGFMSGYEIATPKMVKAAHEDAKIYIGGGEHSGGNGEVFNGTIKGVKVFDSALSDEQIAQIRFPEFTEYTVDMSAGTFDGSGNYRTSWTHASSTLTLTCPASNMNSHEGLIQLHSGQAGSSTYTLTVPAGYKIVKYSFDYAFGNSGTGDKKFVVGGTEYAVTATRQTLLVKNVNAQTAEFVLSGANEPVKVSNFVVEVKAPTAEEIAAAKATAKSGVETNADKLGEALGYYSYTANGEKLYTAAGVKTAIDAAETIAAINAIAESFALNVPEVGKYYRIKGKSGNYIDASSIYNNQTAKTGQMSMKSADACNYLGTIFLLDEGNRLKNVATGTYVKDTHSIGADKNGANCWTFAASTRELGYLTLTSNYSGSKELHDNSGNRADRCSSICGDRHDFVIEEVEAVTLTINAPSKFNVSATWNGETKTLPATWTTFVGFTITESALSAAGNATYTFTGFSEGDQSLVKEVTIASMDADRTLTANFTPSFFGATLAEAAPVQIYNDDNNSYFIKLNAVNDFANKALNSGACTYTENEMWYFVGTSDNFLMYNHKAGADYAVKVAGTGDGSAATMVAVADATPLQLKAMEDGSYRIAPASSTDANVGFNMYGGVGYDIKLYNGTGSDWLFRIMSKNPLTINYELEGTQPLPTNTRLIEVGCTCNGVTGNIIVEPGRESKIYLPAGQSFTLTRAWQYRGYTFNGFKVGEGYADTYTADAIPAEGVTVSCGIDEANDYQYLYWYRSEDINAPYRIPAITVTKSGKVLAISDYRTCGDDIGMGEVDIMFRRSTESYDNWDKKSWTAEDFVADGQGGNQNVFNVGFGDAAVVSDRESNKTLVMAVAGKQRFNWATATSHNSVARIVTENDGDTWEITDLTNQFFGDENVLFPGFYAGFITSGRILQSSTYKAPGAKYYRIYGVAATNDDGNGIYPNYALYSDDFGATWKMLGGSLEKGMCCDAGNETTIEELPNGDLVVSVRKSGGRYFNIFNYGNGEDDKANGIGEWEIKAGDTKVTSSFVSADCNGELLRVGNVLLHSHPKRGYQGKDRSNVAIFYKVLDPEKDYTAAEIATGWQELTQVSYIGSAYSTMTLLPDGKTVGFLYEEDPDNGTFAYCIVYKPIDLTELLTPEEQKEAFVVNSTIGQYEIGTFYANDAMVVPEGVTAYVATAEPEIDGATGTLTMTKVEDGIIPAQTGALICGKPGTYSFKLADTKGETDVTKNLMPGYAGIYEHKAVELPTDGSTNYVLTVKEGVAGFYRKDEGFKVYNNKAYLQVPATAGVNALRIRFAGDDSTGIEHSEFTIQNSEFIYDLQGRRVANPTKGIYIVNGKKVVIK